MHEDDDDYTKIPHISLFSGYGGIDRALRNVFGRRLCTIAYCEREAFACANLEDKIEEGRLDAAPIFTDVRTFPWEQYAPFMAEGILSFGFPCQPVSCAGKRRVTEDERWLFDIVADGIAILKPGLAFAENVEGLLSAKMPDGKPVIARIYERLEEMAYKVECGIFSAEELGAPHQRKRVFILAHSVHLLQGGRAFSTTQARPDSTDGTKTLGLPFLKGMEGPHYNGQIPGGLQQNFIEPSRWPARPGEPQYEWEEPRTVADAPQ